MKSLSSCVRISSVLILAAFTLFNAAASAENTEEVVCRLGPDGVITTWLVGSAPETYDPEKEFAQQPFWIDAEPLTEIADIDTMWHAHATPAPYLDLGPQCFAAGETVFYAACELKAEKSGDYRLDAVYWARAAVWLDDKLVIDGAPADGLIQKGNATVRLEAGKTHRLLVKLASRNREAFLQLSVSTAEPGPPPVTCRFHTPPGRSSELLAGSLAIASDADGLVAAGKETRLLIHAPAGLPLVQGEVAVRPSVLDHEGRLITKLDERKTTAEELGKDGLSLAWAVPENTKARKYIVLVEIFRGDRKAGELRKSFHIAEGLAEWCRTLVERLGQAELQAGPRWRTEPDAAFARLKIEKAALHARQGAADPEKIIEEVEACDLAVARLEKHERRPVGKGLSELAYISDVDDGVQPYYVYVPAKHDGKTRLPVVVYLHGYFADLDKLNWAIIPTELLQFCEQHGYYLVAPFARSNTDFQGVGEADVMKVLDLFTASYPVDASRVFLLGYSMGAMGAYTVAAHYPDRWRGVVAISGRADYYLWKQLDREKVEPYKRLLLDAEFAAEMAENFRNLPVLIYHGSEDSLVQVEQARTFAEKLRLIGADVTCRELPGQDHWIMSEVLRDDAIFKWMNDRGPRPDPTEVDFTSYSIKYRQAYWATVLEVIRWGEPFSVHAKLDPAGKVLDVKTQNVATLRLDLGAMPPDKPGGAVRINGREHKVEKAGPATFEVAETKLAGKLRKTPLLCGPVKDAFNQRFLVVAGAGGGTEAEVERFAQELRRAAAEWYLFTKSTPILKRDVDVTAADVERSNLILHGRPSDNLKLKEIADRLPIKITDEGFEFQGKKYANDDHGLVMIYPNPANPTKYVVIRSGLPYGEQLSANHKYDLLPDFVIFTRGVDYDGTDRAVVAGFFDENWQVDERLIWRRADAGPGTVTEPPPAPGDGASPPD